MFTCLVLGDFLRGGRCRGLEVLLRLNFCFFLSFDLLFFPKPRLAVSALLNARRAIVAFGLGGLR